ncbi:MAG: hypothetical protein MRY63_01245 [Neomegalonema sp.]|nr:hypothetical protein [Neomegalonema sp.]
MSTGFPTLLATRTLQATITRSKEQLTKAQAEFGAERASDIAERMNGDIGRVQRLEKMLSDLETRKASSTFLTIRADTTQNLLDDVRQQATNFSASSIQVNGGSNSALVSSQAVTARTGLEMAFSALNASVSGQSLFGGAATDVQPLGDMEAFREDIRAIVLAQPDAASALAAVETYMNDGSFDAAYYQGSSNDAPSVEIASGRRLNVDVRANDDSIKQVLAGFAIAAVADDPALSTQMGEDLISGANSKLIKGADAITGKQAEIGIMQSEIERLSTRYEAEKITLTTAIDDLVGVDEYEAATRITNMETQLEANYLLTARIANLSLTNYLR